MPRLTLCFHQHSGLTRHFSGFSEVIIPEVGPSSAAKRRARSLLMIVLKIGYASQGISRVDRMGPRGSGNREWILAKHRYLRRSRDRLLKPLEMLARVEPPRRSARHLSSSEEGSHERYAPASY